MITCPAMMLGGGSYFEKWFLALMVHFLGYVDMAHETFDCSDCNQSGVTKKKLSITRSNHRKSWLRWIKRTVCPELTESRKQKMDPK